jgi:hypothetical protein
MGTGDSGEVGEGLTRAALERLGQPGLAQDGVGGVAARNADGYREVSLSDRAVPDFVAALPCRTSVQPTARSKSRSGRSNCGTIQATAGSASRSAVI